MTHYIVSSKYCKIKATISSTSTMRSGQVHTVTCERSMFTITSNVLMMLIMMLRVGVGNGNK